MAILDIDGLRSVLGGVEGLTPETIQAILDLDVDYEDKTSELEQQIEIGRASCRERVCLYV